MKTPGDMAFWLSTRTNTATAGGVGSVTYMMLNFFHRNNWVIPQKAIDRKIIELIKYYTNMSKIYANKSNELAKDFYEQNQMETIELWKYFHEVE